MRLVLAESGQISTLRSSKRYVVLPNLLWHQRHGARGRASARVPICVPYITSLWTKFILSQGLQAMLMREPICQTGKH